MTLTAAGDRLHGMSFRAFDHTSKKDVAVLDGGRDTGENALQRRNVTFGLRQWGEVVRAPGKNLLPFLETMTVVGRPDAVLECRQVTSRHWSARGLVSVVNTE
jgi:hypothetical protein